MNSYRVALILCRAVVVALWWSAGIHFVSVLISGVIYLLSPSFSFGFPTTVTSAIPFIIAATFLHIFSTSLAASMTGKAMLEGDAITTRVKLEPPERALANAGAGLFLLFFGATTVVPTTLSAISLLLRPNSGSSLFGFVGFLIPSVLQCLVGFMLAFLMGLKRVVKAQ